MPRSPRRRKSWTRSTLNEWNDLDQPMGLVFCLDADWEKAQFQSSDGEQKWTGDIARKHGVFYDFNRGK